MCVNPRLLRIRGSQPLVLAFNDCGHHDESGPVATPAQVEAAILFGWSRDATAESAHSLPLGAMPLAAALAILADPMGKGEKRISIDAIRQLAPRVAPNLLAFSLAGSVLGRDGKLENARLDHFDIDDAVQKSRYFKVQ